MCDAIRHGGPGHCASHVAPGGCVIAYAGTLPVHRAMLLENKQRAQKAPIYSSKVGEHLASLISDPMLRLSVDPWCILHSSPIYSNFTESLHGVSTIRAYGMQQNFIKESNGCVDEFNRVSYYLFAR